METETLSLYQGRLLDHSRNPRNEGRMFSAALRVKAENPMCGDEVTLHFHYVKPHPDRIVIDSLTFTGSGCSICMASASMLTCQVVGKPLPECLDVLSAFENLMSGKSPEPDLLGEAVALGVAREFPQRLRCVRLAWEALADGLDKISKKYPLKPAK